MEGRGGPGGCCIARYVGGGAYDMSQVDRIMLRFRPIAPKPVASGSGSGGSTPENSEKQFKAGRSKRRYVTKKRKASPTPSKAAADPLSDAVVTLSLLPETPDQKDSPARVSPSDPPVTKNQMGKGNNSPPICRLDFKNDNHVPQGAGHVTTRPDQKKAVAVGSCVTVECVGDTWVNGQVLGCTDEERIMNMERDSCPGFISDGRDRVLWTNKAYRDMVAGQVAGEEMAVLLVMKEWVSLPVTYPGITCKVRVTWGRERSSSSSSLTVPCDVWRMQGGGYAWRLDVKAALCLGRYSVR